MNHMPSPAIQQWIADHPFLSGLLAVVLLVLVVKVIIWHFRLTGGGKMNNRE